jgi:hypothetical protein
MRNINFLLNKPLPYDGENKVDDAKMLEVQISCEHSDCPIQCFPLLSAAIVPDGVVSESGQLRSFSRLSSKMWDWPHIAMVCHRRSPYLSRGIFSVPVSGNKRVS